MKTLSVITFLFFSIIITNKLWAVDLVDLNDFPGWFKDAMNREINIDDKSTLKIKPFNVNSEILGEAKLIEEGEGTWYYQIEVGIDTPVECYVFSEYDGAANSLHSIVELSLSGVETLNKLSLSSKLNFAVNNGIVGDTPYLLFDTLYTLGEGNKKVSGVIKGLAAETNQSLQVCIHNSVGYRNTFFTIFESFIQAFLANEDNPEFFKTVYQISYNEMPVGYATEEYTMDDEGDINMINHNVVLIPVDSNSIARSDSIKNSWTRSDGSLINAHEYTINNGSLASQYSITNKDEKWVVDGELQGKAIQATLEYDKWLLSSFGSYLETINLSKSEKKSDEFYMWISDADPTSVLKIVISKISDDPNANYQFEMGPLVMKMSVDDKGIVRKGTWKEVSSLMEMKLIYVKGEPTIQ